MKRVLVVLAVSLMLLFSVWGEAYADDPGGGPIGEDHPWSGEDFGEDGRNRWAAISSISVGCVLLPSSVILYDYSCIDELRSILWGTNQVKTTPNVRVR